MKLSLLFSVLLLALAPAHAEVYKWVDADGNVHYSDSPPPPGARKSERKRLGDNAAAEPSMPYVLQEAVKNHPVTLYVYDCGEGCTQAMALLSKRGVPHTVKNPFEPAIREELKQVTGGQVVVPVMQVGRAVLRGFEEGQWNSALDIAGYPATALIKLPPARPVAMPNPAAAAQEQPALEGDADEGAGDPVDAEIPTAETPAEE